MPPEAPEFRKYPTGFFPILDLRLDVQGQQRKSSERYLFGAVSRNSNTAPT